MKTLIAPSILSCNFACLGEEIKHVIKAGADMIHVDVMDNHYVPNLTVGPLICKALRDYGITAPLDVHLMIEPVDRIIPDFIKAGADIITFHPEASLHIDRTLQLIKDGGCQAGLAFNPATPINYLEYLIDKIDMILIMSVNPGFGGQEFIKSALKKIEAIAQLVKNSGRKINISIDGGINKSTIKSAYTAGANCFVVGSAIFKTENYHTAITELRDKIGH
jgi:ribulose-phosphate 3-epimerase